MRLGVRECLVDGRRVAGDVVIEGSKIAAIGVPPAGERGLAVPGFIDVQVNGFGGIDFAAADVDGYRTAGAAMAATGVTAYQPTYICLPEAQYEPALSVASAAQRLDDAPRLLGVHLEGPFLSPDQPGAHDPANMRPPDLNVARTLLAAGPVTYTTVAPELPGALELIDFFIDAGVTVALGHSDADAAAAAAGFDRGAGAVTHLFNAQRRWRHRDPGIAGTALIRDDVVITVILDGHHLAAETVELIRRCAAGRIVPITDAISAAGRPDGEYWIGDRRVTVRSTVAALEDGTLAGSVLTMDQAVRNFVELGATPEEALDGVARVPATLLGRNELGVLAPGTPADIVVLDDGLRVTRTLVGGRELFSA
jgi:N-acetylglucosamine-6-phosphate deacetylase